MLTNEAKIAILRLRLLVVRAAQKDSLKWWEDDSLTKAGDYLTERLFLMDRVESARALALEAGRTRYRMAFHETKDRLHLFHLDSKGQIDFELHDVRLSDVDVPHEPIPSHEVMHVHLMALTGKPATYEVVGGIDANNCLEILPNKPVNKLSALEIAETLSWACLESPVDEPYFPYIRWNS